jgi:hypothetical protein
MRNLFWDRKSFHFGTTFVGKGASFVAKLRLFPVTKTPVLLEGTHMKMRLVASAAAVAVAAFLSSGAQASVIPVLDSVTADGSDFLFSYDGQLAPDQGVIAGDQLVIVDFAGYVPGSVHSSLADVTASVSYTLPTGMLLDPGFTDNPAIPDLVFTYTGPAFDTSGGPFPSQVDFMGLSAESTDSLQGTGSFSAVAVKNDGAQTGTTTYNVGQVGVPIPSGVPEPATWAMFLIGFGAVGWTLRGCRNASALTT